MAVNFKDLPDTTTPINASNLNKIQSDLKSEVFEGTVRLTDCDDATTPGIYQYIGTTANIPEKAGHYGSLIVFKTTVGAQVYLTQIAVGNYSLGNTIYFSMARRTYTNVWSDWDYFGEYDSGWLNPTLGSNFEVYSSNYKMQLRKIGEKIYIQGAVKPKAEISTGNQGQVVANSNVVLVLPESYRPNHIVSFVMRGSGMNKYILSINNTGHVYVQNYGVATNIAIPAGTALHINCSFVIND